MSQTVEASRFVEQVSLGALFLACLKVSLLGFGGGLVWACRIVVDQKRWMDDREFGDCFAVSQNVPRPNMILMMGLVGLDDLLGHCRRLRNGPSRGCRLAQRTDHDCCSGIDARDPHQSVVDTADRRALGGLGLL